MIKIFFANTTIYAVMLLSALISSTNFCADEKPLCRAQEEETEALYFFDNNSPELIASFKVLIELYKISAKTCDKDDKGIDVSSLYVNSYGTRLAQGCVLQVDGGGNLGHATSPWGLVSLRTPFLLDGKKQEQFKLFTDSCEISFLHNTKESDPQAIFCIDEWKDENKITSDQLEQYRGTNRLIIAHIAEATSIYEVRSVNGIQLPKANYLPLSHPPDLERSYKACQESLKKMMQNYLAEQQ